MGFRYRKSIQIVPGVRMTFSKSGVSYSAGGKGYRVTKRADGRVQRTTSIPHTGLSHTTVSGNRRSSPRPARSPAAPSALSAPSQPVPKHPALLAPKGEKDLYKAVQAKDVAAMERVGQEHSDYALAAASLAGLSYLSAGDLATAADEARARELFSWVFATGADPGADPFIVKYLDVGFTVHPVPGITARMRLDRGGVGLALAELHQQAGNVDAAIAVVEQLEPTTFAALLLAELYSEKGRHDEVVSITEGVENQDDASALLCVYRGVAFRGQGYFDAARESFKEALKSKKRDPIVRHRALFERAHTYEMEGKRAMARKDLERIMAEDSDYEGLAASLAELSEPKS